MSYNNLNPTIDWSFDMPRIHQKQKVLAEVHIHQPFFSTFFVVFSRFFLYSEAFGCNTTSDWLNHMIWFSQSEVVLHSNLQIFVKKTKNVLENGLVNTGPGQPVQTVLDE